MGRIGGVDGADLGESASVNDVDFACKVAKSRKRNEPPLGVEGDEIVWRGAEIVQRPYPLVK